MRRSFLLGDFTQKHCVQFPDCCFFVLYYCKYSVHEDVTGVRDAERDVENRDIYKERRDVTEFYFHRSDGEAFNSNKHCTELTSNI